MQRYVPPRCTRCWRRCPAAVGNVTPAEYAHHMRIQPARHSVEPYPCQHGRRQNVREIEHEQLALAPLAADGSKDDGRNSIIAFDVAAQQSRWLLLE
jgi:hypothetical protein